MQFTELKMWRSLETKKYCGYLAEIFSCFFKMIECEILMLLGYWKLMWFILSGKNTKSQRFLPLLALFRCFQWLILWISLCESMWFSDFTPKPTLSTPQDVVKQLRWKQKSRKFEISNSDQRKLTKVHLWTRAFLARSGGAFIWIQSLTAVSYHLGEGGYQPENVYMLISSSQINWMALLHYCQIASHLKLTPYRNSSGADGIGVTSGKMSRSFFWNDYFLLANVLPVI